MITLMKRRLSWEQTLLLGILFILPFRFTRAETAADWPGANWPKASAVEVGMDSDLLGDAVRYAETGGGSGFITRHGKLVRAWGDQEARYDLKSTTKSIGVTALGLAMADGRVKLNNQAVQYHPNLAAPPESNRETGWIPEITIQHLATQTAGFEKPGGYTRLTHAPGTVWAYSDGGPNWLAECITLVYKRDLNELMFERVFEPIGVDRTDLAWRSNAYRDKTIDGITRREFGSGISANVDAMARIGYLYLREGKWGDRQIIPSDFVKKARTAIPEVIGLPEIDPEQYGNASDHYGLLWWNNADGTLENVPRDAFWSWGLYDSLIFVVPSLDIVVSRAGKSWKRENEDHYDVLRPFFDPIVASVLPSATESLKRLRKSPVIAGIEWAPVDTILRMAEGSDNWPVTWGDDDRLYTAYGDGWGFEPKTPRKLSLGLAVITGGPEDPVGVNLRSPTGEQIGDGAQGKKASGMLMVDGTLYMLVRNAANAKLAWSTDHGATWEWADWRFETSFGCPSFINYGRNYAGARDDYVYIVTPDTDTAYERADSMVLARVPKDRVKERDAYEFFQRLDDVSSPVWTASIDQRGAVFTRKNGCYRSSITYNPALKRYIWCQTGAGEQPRFEGGLFILDAPEPWGPWTTVYATERWDVGPGETSCFPTKWMSDDGAIMYLLFSGDDCFSVRKGVVVGVGRGGRIGLGP
jgi:CubicO group peptidase (beta-lactamase class C family)